MVLSREGLSLLDLLLDFANLHVSPITGGMEATDRLAVLSVDGEELFSVSPCLLEESRAQDYAAYLVLHRLESDFDHFE